MFCECQVQFVTVKYYNDYIITILYDIIIVTQGQCPVHGHCFYLFTYLTDEWPSIAFFIFFVNDFSNIAEVLFSGVWLYFDI